MALEWDICCEGTIRANCGLICWPITPRELGLPSCLVTRLGRNSVSPKLRVCGRASVPHIFRLPFYCQVGAYPLIEHASMRHRRNPRRILLSALLNPQWIG